MVSLYFDPNGEKLFDTYKSTSNPQPPFQSQPIPGDSMSTNIAQENVANLKARIQELESELALKKLITVICYYNMTEYTTRYIEKKSIPMIAWCPAFSNLG